MAEGADIHDVGSLTDFHNYLASLREQLGLRCDEIRLQFQRMSGFLEGQANDYWRTSLHRAQQRLSEARDALTLCRAKVRAEDHEACSEQQKEFDKAKARLVFCETRVRQLKTCRLEWEQFALQALPRVAEATDIVETQLPRARAELAQILILLEQYRQGR